MMIETIAADTILSVFSGIYYHILCVEHGRQGKKLAACVLSFIALNMILDLVLYGQDVFFALMSFVLTVLFVLCWIPWLYNVLRGRALLYAMIQYGLVVLILLPLSMVFPCLFLSDLILPGYLVKGVIYVIACPICLRFVKRRRESGIFLLPVLLPLSNAVLLTAFVYPGKIEVLWYMLFSLIYFVVAAFNGYALYRFGGKMQRGHGEGRRKTLVDEYERLRLVSHDVRNHQLTMQILRSKGEHQLAHEYAEKIDQKIMEALK